MKGARVALVIAVTLVAIQARADEQETWATETTRIRPVLETRAPLEEHLLSACGVADGALQDVAHQLAATGPSSSLDADALATKLRMAGSPLVWPHAWIISGTSLDHDRTIERMRSALPAPTSVARRCGVSMHREADGRTVIAVVQADALADLTQAIPTRSRTGNWITVDASLSVSASGARVVVLGPSGAPHDVPTSFNNGRVLARFPLERPGAFLVQVVADLAGGPRPVLEALSFADVYPHVATSSAAPGEDVAAAAREDDTLFAMLAAARDAAGTTPAQQDPDLSRLAAQHAQRMHNTHTVAHDVGDGDPVARIGEAMNVREVGENVVHAANVRLAHRALYASPSHRANLLNANYTEVGIGVVRDADGSIWACELFVRP